MSRNGIAFAEVTVIVRTVGERTTAACRQLLEAQVPAEQVFDVSARPFAAALRESLAMGLREGRPWTLCVDADVLPASDAVARMFREAEALPPEFCEVEGVVLDKFFGGARPAGNHLYRTRWLCEALACLDDAAHEIRPEAGIIRRMAERGHPWKQVSQVFGLHGFEQAGCDIFRTCFVHAHKHAEFTPLLLGHWRRHASEDSDFAIALRGLAAGIATTGPVEVDVADPVVQAGWQTTVADGLTGPADGLWTTEPAAVDQRISEFREAPEFRRMPTQMLGYHVRPNWWTRYRALSSQLGPVRAGIWMAGSVVLRGGAALRRIGGPAKPL